MTDQDLDGSHIKGLGVNLFQAVWPSSGGDAGVHWIHEHADPQGPQGVRPS